MTYRLPWKRRLFTHPAVQHSAAWLVTMVLKCMWLTFRITRDIDPQAEPYLLSQRQGVFCFWHGRMIVLPFFKPQGKEMFVLGSRHRDADMIGYVIRRFKISQVRGSSSRGGREAVRELLKKLKQGDNISITPDGPRGPARKAARGAMMIARLSNTPVIPVTYSASSCWRLKSWDSLMIPKPFARVIVKVGAPFIGGADEESLMEIELNRLTDAADREAMGC